MLGKDEEKQSQFMFVNLDEFVPQDHLLRTIKRSIDFSFIYDKVKDLYSPVGRGSVDPVLLVKMLLIGYWYGIASERKLEQEVKLNLAYRWFLGLDLAEAVPDHSTISQNRRRRFKNSPLFQEIFDSIGHLKEAHIDKVYAAKTKDCKVCPNRKSCIGPKQKFRILKVALFHEYNKRNRDRATTEDYARIQRLRRIWCEGSFGVLKAQHNMAMTYKRGLVNIQEQCLLSASALNIKRMVKALA